MRGWFVGFILLVWLLPGLAPAADAAEPLVVGETFTIASKVLGETRRINVYKPPAVSDKTTSLPVLYMLDGGVAEDFLHIAGLVQVSVGNGTMRPFLLVGIENTERRRDLTPPTDNPEDRKIAPRVGGSAKFRAFLRDELMAAVKQRYSVTDETAIVGESAAGLFVVEALFLEPGLFDTYIAVDPSLWWNNAELVNTAEQRLRAMKDVRATLFFTASTPQNNDREALKLAETLKRGAPAGLRVIYEPMPGELHSTIFHPTALKAFRLLFKPPAASQPN